MQWHSRRVAASVRWSYVMLIAGEVTDCAGKIERFGRNCILAEIPPSCSIFVCLFFVFCILETKCPTNRDICEFP